MMMMMMLFIITRTERFCEVFTNIIAYQRGEETHPNQFFSSSLQIVKYKLLTVGGGVPSYRWKLTNSSFNTFHWSWNKKENNAQEDSIMCWSILLSNLISRWFCVSGWFHLSEMYSKQLPSLSLALYLSIHRFRYTWVVCVDNYIVFADLFSPSSSSSSFKYLLKRIDLPWVSCSYSKMWSHVLRTHHNWEACTDRQWLVNSTTTGPGEFQVCKRQTIHKQPSGLKFNIWRCFSCGGLMPKHDHSRGELRGIRWGSHRAVKNGINLIQSSSLTGLHSFTAPGLANAWKGKRQGWQLLEIIWSEYLDWKFAQTMDTNYQY